MSADISLRGLPRQVECECDYCFHIHSRTVFDFEFEDFITSNLVPMARAAGLHLAIYQPQTLGATTGGELIVPLVEGILSLQAEPQKFQALGPSDPKLGSYDELLRVAMGLLHACLEQPDALIRVS